MSDYKGGCACGLVRYESRAEPTFSYLCQCRDCQRASGTGHAAIFMVEKEGLSVSGELRYFECRGESDNLITRGFCPVCGSPVLATISAYPEARFVHASSLDDPSSFQPRQVLWRSSAQPWDVSIRVSPPESRDQSQIASNANLSDRFWLRLRKNSNLRTAS